MRPQQTNCACICIFFYIHIYSLSSYIHMHVLMYIWVSLSLFSLSLYLPTYLPIFLSICRPLHVTLPSLLFHLFVCGGVMSEMPMSQLFPPPPHFPPNTCDQACFVAKLYHEYVGWDEIRNKQKHTHLCYHAYLIVKLFVRRLLRFQKTSDLQWFVHAWYANLWLTIAFTTFLVYSGRA